MTRGDSLQIHWTTKHGSNLVATSLLERGAPDIDVLQCEQPSETPAASNFGCGGGPHVSWGEQDKVTMQRKAGLVRELSA